MQNAHTPIRPEGDDVALVQKWGTRRSFTDSFRLQKGDGANHVPILDRILRAHVFMGLKPVGEERELRAEWAEDGTELRVVEGYDFAASQGRHPITVTHA